MNKYLELNELQNMELMAKYGDIDIIFFDFFKIKSLKLTVPHWDWQNRVSVTIPLIYLGRVKK